MSAWILLAAAYLIGSVPTSLIFGRALGGIDLRAHGSGNLGATNAYRVLGAKAAAVILAIDIAKGWFPTQFFPDWDDRGAMWALLYGTAAVVGHVFSAFVSFRGGKGVATGAGVFLALAPLAVLGAFALWLGVLAVSGYVSLASIVAATLLPAGILITRGADAVFLLSLALAAFVLWTHRANIARLRRGHEHRVRRGEKVTS